VAGHRVWVTPDRAWRLDVRLDGRWQLVHETMPVGGGRFGLREAQAALDELPGAPGWEQFVED
jgi:hypothetical protein